MYVFFQTLLDLPGHVFSFIHLMSFAFFAVYNIPPTPTISDNCRTDKSNIIPHSDPLMGGLRYSIAGQLELRHTPSVSAPHQRVAQQGAMDFIARMVGVRDYPYGICCPWVR